MFPLSAHQLLHIGVQIVPQQFLLGCFCYVYVLEHPLLYLMPSMYMYGAAFSALLF